MQRTIRAALLALSIAPLGATPAAAQLSELQRALIGGAVGVAGGAVVTMSTVVARAHLQNEYLFSVAELIHWQSTPMIAAPAAGVAFGMAGRDPLLASIVGSTTGMLTGAGIGALVGWFVSAQPEGPWAGGVIGAGAGMAIGGLLAGALAWSRQEDDDPASGARLEVRVPLPPAGR